MHTVFALLCFVVVIHWLIFPYPSGLLHWHCGNLTIAPVPAKQPWWIWINTSCEFIMNDWITTTKQSTTKPCAYFSGYTVHCFFDVGRTRPSLKNWWKTKGWTAWHYIFCDRHSCVLSARLECHTIVIKFTNYCPVYAMFLNYTLCLNSHPWNVTITISFTILYCTYFPSPNPGLYIMRFLSWGLTCRLSNFIYKGIAVSNSHG